MARTKYHATFLEILVRDEWMRSRTEGSHIVLERCLKRIARLNTEQGAYEKEVEAFIHEYEIHREQPLLFPNANGCLSSYPHLCLPQELVRTAITDYQELFNGEIPAKVTLSEEYQEAMQAKVTVVFQEEEVQIGYSTNYPLQTLMCWSQIRQKHR